MKTRFVVPLVGSALGFALPAFADEVPSRPTILNLVSAGAFSRSSA
jgi:hypothetical protein